MVIVAVSDLARRAALCRNRENLLRAIPIEPDAVLPIVHLVDDTRLLGPLRSLGLAGEHDFRFALRHKTD